MNKTLFLLLLIVGGGFFCFPSCKKDAPEPIIPPVKPPDTPAVYVPIHQPGDTIHFGAGYAKKLTANWSAEAYCSVMNFVDTSLISVALFTYSKADINEQRESLFFSFVPKSSVGQPLAFKYMTGATLKPGYTSPSYTTWRLDGDVVEDRYSVDETATDNYFKLTKIDWAKKRVEGTFTASFKITEPRVNPLNPKKVKFSGGRFWANIQD